MQKALSRHTHTAMVSPQVLSPRVFSRHLAALQRLLALPAALGLALCVTSPAEALPGFFAGKGDASRVSNSSQVVLLQKGDQTVVTVWADYEGPLDRFALVVPVPSDVSLADIKALKR